MTNIEIALSLYAATLGITSWKALKFPIVSDGALGYEEFKWLEHQPLKTLWRQNGLVASSLMTTSLPNLIAKLLRLPREKTFRLVPGVFLSLVPALSFLIALDYASQVEALALGLFTISHFFISFYPNHGRMGPGWASLYGMVIALSMDSEMAVIASSLVMVMSHYGTSLYSLYVFGLTWLTNPADLTLTWLVMSLMGFSWFWYSIVHPAVEGIAWGVIYHTLRSFSLKSLFDPNNKEPVIAALFHRAGKMNTAQHVEFVLSWIIIAGLSTGATLSMLAPMSLTERAPALAAMSLIVIGLTSRRAGLFYGLMRLYFTALPFVQGYLLSGIEFLSNLLDLDYLQLLFGLIILYGLSVTGFFHRLYGYDKYAGVKAYGRR